MSDAPEEQENLEFMSQLQKQGYEIALIHRSTAQKTCTFDEDHGIWTERPSKANGAQSVDPTTFVAMMNARLSETDQYELTASQLLVAITLAGRAAGKEDGIAWPSYDLMAHDTKLSRRTVIRCVKALEEKGFLRKIRGGIIDGKNVSNRYIIAMPENYPQKRRGDTVSPPSDTVSPKEVNEEVSSLSKGGGNGELFEENEISASKPSDLFIRILPEHLQTTDVLLALSQFEKDRRERRKKMTTQAVRILCRKIEKWTPEQIARAVEIAIESGWSSLYPPREPQESAGATRKGTSDTAPQDFSKWQQKPKQSQPEPTPEPEDHDDEKR